jgi:hypothetical protein
MFGVKHQQLLTRSGISVGASSTGAKKKKLPAVNHERQKMGGTTTTNLVFV